ncbi:MAG: c-type cytochrome [Anaerolineae bacterium]|nr:c-type cytochrome [Anaerolineae bacterium]
MKRMQMLHWTLGMLASALLVVACGGEADEEQAALRTATPAQVAVAATYDPQTIEEGAANYGVYCIACHGAQGVGIEGLGSNLAESEFVHRLSDAELLAFIQEGRSADHPDNVSGVAMPAKGGFPSLSVAQINTIIAYLRTLQAL